MFHIVFAGDENYLKYTAVCITSIVKNTDISKTFHDFLKKADKEKLGRVPTNLKNPSNPSNLKNNDVPEEYIFHILTDYVSEDTKNKLSQLAAQLNDIFPTQINIHIVEDNEFAGQPRWRNNYLTYYRLKIGKILSNHTEKALYLDGDILVNCDVRELFAVDLGERICATVANVIPAVRTLDGRLDKNKYEFPHGAYYFNAGVMLINLVQWRAQGIESKVFKFLRKYIPRSADQDALNAVINQNLVKLPFKWNMMVHKGIPFSEAICMDESPHYNIQHTKAVYSEGLENPKIIHYSPKPWQGKGFSISIAFKPFQYPNFDLWWDMVEKTPIYREELEAIKETARYKQKVHEEEKQEKMLGAGTFSFILLWIKFKRESRPYMKKVEAPFKKIRNKIRARKIKNVGVL